MKKLSLEDLEQFTGSENLYQISLSKILKTDGVEYVCQTAGAYWLAESIAFAQSVPRVKREEFQSWRLQVKENVGILTCEDGNDNEVYREIISYTDFPLPSITFWLTDGILLLPSEY